MSHMNLVVPPLVIEDAECNGGWWLLESGKEVRLDGEVKREM